MTNNPEPDLPLTPTNEGRRPRISNFGYNVVYQDLWPLLVGMGGTMLLGMIFAAGAIRAHWAVGIFVSSLPLLAAHFYVKMFVEDALPHTQQDTLARVISLEPDFQSPLFRRVPVIPRFRAPLTMAADPQVEDGLHPLLALKKQFDRANRGKGGK